MRRRPPGLRLPLAILLHLAIILQPTPSQSKGLCGDRAAVAVVRQNQTGARDALCLCEPGTRCEMLSSNSEAPTRTLCVNLAANAIIEPRQVLSLTPREGFDRHACADCRCTPLSTPLILPPVAPVLEKRAHSRNVRFVFFAGLEGTGHHRWSAVRKRMLHETPELVNFTLTTAGTTFEGASWNWTAQTGFHLYHTNRDNDSQPRPTLLQDIAEAQSSLLALAARAPAQALYWLNAWHETMSYPGYKGPLRPYQHPDLLLLARIAESVGADLRIVLMLRDPAELWISAARRFFPEAVDRRLNVRVYSSMMDDLMTMMSMLDPRFIVCEDVDSPSHGSADGVASITTFLHPQMHPNASRILASLHEPPHIEISTGDLLRDQPDLSPILEELRAKHILMLQRCQKAAEARFLHHQMVQQQRQQLHRQQDATGRKPTFEESDG